MSSLKLSVKSLKGVGDKAAARLQKLELNTLQDLLLHLPLRYEDRTRLFAINSLEVDKASLVRGRIEHVAIQTTGRKMLSCHISDGTGILILKFFHYSTVHTNALKKGVWVQCFGETRWGFNNCIEIVHPEYQVINKFDAVITENALTPIYPSTEGLYQKDLQKFISQALTICDSELIEYLPESVLQQFGYVDFRAALTQIHSPKLESKAGKKFTINSALQRLAHEELIVHYLTMRTAKQQAKCWQAPVFSPNKKVEKAFLKTLPFKLTGAQLRVIAEIQSDCERAQPMLRLVQGDVGSGKTLVAAMAALSAISNSYQVALMVPTELLAEQHNRNFSHWFAPFNFKILFLTGQLKGKAREQGLRALATGEIQLAIGTHALFQEQVQFQNLGLVIIDEQHRFGVDQRSALLNKGEQGEMRPHQLVMTATPIPRTLAMMQYADLDVSIIDELPPNRKPVVTRVLSAQRRDEVIAKINDWVAKKNQAYWVCTLIEESDVLQGEAAETSFKMLVKTLPKVRIGLVHGRMKATEKEVVMTAFKNHELDLLVATTVIEVGVDVPNASLMVIENPERLGLSQLHQLRGRVGRGDSESYCLLLYSALPEMARERLSIMREHNDGFVIAEKDLELRGAGEVFGTRQKGQLRFKTVNPEMHGHLFETVQLWGDYVATAVPKNVQPLIERWLDTAVNYADV
ncbi:MAG: ATP-dependent DNA helicase RecG [Methylococcales bacterium]|nr:ATP-dependent DNA helicase RecG [Methylococcales bacterium]